MRRALLVVGLALGLAGCGLKGPLTLPAQSENVKIRGPGAGTTQPAEPTSVPAPSEQPAATAPTTAPPPAPSTAPEALPGTATPTAPATTTPAPRRYDRLPPPPLPASNPGTTRGG